jgi:hypothetical protein
VALNLELGEELTHRVVLNSPRAFRQQSRSAMTAHIASTKLSD